MKTYTELKTHLLANGCTIRKKFKVDSSVHRFEFWVTPDGGCCFGIEVFQNVDAFCAWRLGDTKELIESVALHLPTKQESEAA
jgi:hypothetical protein